MIRCGNCKSRHDTAADVRECYAETAAQNAEYDAEMAYERHLEDRGYDEARAQEQYEAAHGVIVFSDALGRAHADYPHEPGTLYDCPACEAKCFCTDGFTCVHCAIEAERTDTRAAYVAESNNRLRQMITTQIRRH